MKLEWTTVLFRTDFCSWAMLKWRNVVSERRRPASLRRSSSVSFDEGDSGDDSLSANDRRRQRRPLTSYCWPLMVFWRTLSTTLAHKIPSISHHYPPLYTCHEVNKRSDQWFRKSRVFLGSTSNTISGVHAEMSGQLLDMQYFYWEHFQEF